MFIGGGGGGGGGCKLNKLDTDLQSVETLGTLQPGALVSLQTVDPLLLVGTVGHTVCQAVGHTAG